MTAPISRRFLFGIFCTLAITTGASSQDASAPLVYDIELVVFRNLAANGTPEDWMLEERSGRHSTAIIEQDEMVSLTVPAFDAASPGVERQLLPRDKFQLTAIAAALQRSRNYQPIAHFGWSQSGSPLNAAVAAPLDDLLPPGTLRGSAALARGRFLHLTLDLSYQPEGEAQRYVLKQTRRMRSTERHYFDHPQFGVIALVTPQTPAGTR